MHKKFNWSAIGLFAVQLFGNDGKPFLVVHFFSVANGIYTRVDWKIQYFVGYAEKLISIQPVTGLLFMFMFMFMFIFSIRCRCILLVKLSNRRTIFHSIILKRMHWLDNLQFYDQSVCFGSKSSRIRWIRRFRRIWKIQRE